MKRYDLSGNWKFRLELPQKGKLIEKAEFDDGIILPSTASLSKKGTPKSERCAGYLTDPYEMLSNMWYQKEISLCKADCKRYVLTLERTRISHLWIDGNYAGTHNSLCTPHRYDITSLLNGSDSHRITIMTDNSSYPTNGGHMTSPDTQTNWNGITGEMFIEESADVYISDIRIFPDTRINTFTAELRLNGADICEALFSVDGHNAKKLSLSRNLNTITLSADGLAEWSEFTPITHTLKITLEKYGDVYETSFGMSNFTANKKYFEINGQSTFLCGKHDGMLFPKTGCAPTDTDSWLKVMKAAKEYGINHYRFHTCCPPDAAFTAADMLGIYMEPELPFWGTFTVEGEEGHNAESSDYLKNEGFAILNEFGNHPSFVMFSMGNELWGNRKGISALMGEYKKSDSRKLYTQGSNSFQFVPEILENDDFFSGVRFSAERLFRGSYASVDGIGHIQQYAPTTAYSYDEKIRPSALSQHESVGGEISIQYGTGVKKVKADSGKEICPEVPVLSHEVGQYAMFPDFREIEKFSGVLKARNFELFRERLNDDALAADYFSASSKFAADCYKNEIETAMRSKELAGFQLLDLQDFTGQGTALVGILDAFMESKGAITAENWRNFCDKTVILAEFDSYVLTAGENFKGKIKLHNFSAKDVTDPEVVITLTYAEKTVFEKRTCYCGKCRNVSDIADFEITVADLCGRCVLEISLAGTTICNSYELWVLPEPETEPVPCSFTETDDFQTALRVAKNGGNVLFFPYLDEKNSLEAEYCTDFWNYTMFNSIAVSMDRKSPVGTHGLLINNSHNALAQFPCATYSTPQWFDIVKNSRSVILDGTGIKPIVATIDNFERNHRLGVLFEFMLSGGKVLVCASGLKDAGECGNALLDSLRRYVSSDGFKPDQTFDEIKFSEMFMR